MRVPHEDHVNARDLVRDVDRLVLVWNLSGIHFTRAKIFFQAHVHGDDNNVSAFLPAQNWDPLASFGDWLTKFETGVVWWIVPMRHAGSGEPENSDSHAADFFDDVRFVTRFF